MKNKFKKLLAISLTALSLSCAAFSMNVSAYGGSQTIYVNGLSGVASIDRTSRQASSSTTSSLTSLYRACSIKGVRSNGYAIEKVAILTKGNVYATVTTTSTNSFVSASSSHTLKTSDQTSSSTYSMSA